MSKIEHQVDVPFYRNDRASKLAALDGVLNDDQIRLLCERDDAPMVHPYSAESIKVDDDGRRILSYGQSSFGYDIRASYKWRIFNGLGTIDPKNVKDRHFVDVNVDPSVVDPLTGDFGKGYIDIPGNSYALTHSLEAFQMPKDVLGICVGKSTYARVGILVNVTPLEPGWKGTLTMEIANLCKSPVRVYANEGIAQLIFLRGVEPAVTYADRKGKYQDQGAEIVNAKV